MKLIEPMKISDGEIPEGEDWIYQVKWDGVRCLAYIKDGSVSLRNRSGMDMTNSFPEVTESLLRNFKGESCILDGEVIVLNQDYKPSFELTNMRAQANAPIRVSLLRKSYPASYIIFDVLEIDGLSLLNEEYRARQRRLLTDFNYVEGNVLPSGSFKDLELTREVVAKHGHEGFVAKNVKAKYQPGERPTSNVRWKSTDTLDAVILGWEKGSGVRYKNFGAFECEVLDDRHRGMRIGVSSGFSGSLLEEIIDSLRVTGEDENYVYVEKELVIEVSFLGVDVDGTIRNPSYSRIRADKVI